MRNNRVMIVDDDKEFLDQLEELLLMSGYEMIAVNESINALETAVRMRPDIILLDIKMPGRNGLQLAEDFRRHVLFRDTPIITMTGFYDDLYIPLIELLGITKCLKKPFKPLDVISEIEAVSRR